jgi:nucleoside-diphosphate kinase
MQRTFAIVKPDAFAAGHAGAILAHIQESGFYHVHKERPFFNDLVKFMTEGPILAMVLEGENAIKRWRDLMGPTDATKAPADSIRGKFGTSIERNATHGSDAEDTAAFEVGYFFSGLELA